MRRRVGEDPWNDDEWHARHQAHMAANEHRLDMQEGLTEQDAPEPYEGSDDDERQEAQDNLREGFDDVDESHLIEVGRHILDVSSLSDYGVPFAERDIPLKRFRYIPASFVRYPTAALLAFKYRPNSIMQNGRFYDENGVHFPMMWAWAGAYERSFVNRGLPASLDALRELLLDMPLEYGRIFIEHFMHRSPVDVKFAALSLGCFALAHEFEVSTDARSVGAYRRTVRSLGIIDRYARDIKSQYGELRNRATQHFDHSDDDEEPAAAEPAEDDDDAWLAAP
jgi:hypothetical protein